MEGQPELTAQTERIGQSAQKSAEAVRERSGSVAAVEEVEQTAAVAVGRVSAEAVDSGIENL